MNRTDKALTHLILLLNGGHEFPDACSIAARKHRVKYDRLQAAYDEFHEDDRAKNDH